MVEQLTWNVGSAGPIRLSTRARLEQRFIHNSDGTSWRWRQQIRVACALGGENAPRAILWTEPFIALNQTSRQSHTLDQIRTFVGLAVPISAYADLEVGYLNQRVYRLNTTLVNNAFPIILSLHF